MPRMDKLIASANKEALVEMVKMAQKRGMAGSNGSWKEFLKVHDKKFGASLSDPSRRSSDDLATFLKTFTKDDEHKFFKKVLECYSNREEVVEQFKKDSPDEETAEQELVRLTLDHLLYPIDYSFPSHEEEWLVIKRTKKEKHIKSTDMIAIDCEMVLCKDGTEALVKVCAVDRNLEVKLDKVIKPNKEVADYRTEITGISAKDLKGVTHSLKDVQKSVKKLLSHGTILVGHSLSNDLQALKLDYSRVVDTSYIFRYANGLAYKKPSLSWLCKSLLGYDLRKEGNPHNCLDDACAAMRLVLARLEGKIGDVIAEEVASLGSTKLLVHRIPVDVRKEDLKSILHGDFTVEVKAGKKFINTYSAFALFKNQRAAIEAFDKLDGSLEKDSVGRLQKLVRFELDSGISGTLCVCKIFHEVTDQLSNKRPAEDEHSPLDKSKKLKMGQTSDQCEAHLKEIERLKRELVLRDEEIKRLDKILVVLTRKQGL